MSRKFTAAEIEEMRRWFIDDGLSYEEIAIRRRRGESRSAIGSILSRNGIRRGRPSKPPAEKRRPAPRQAAPKPPAPGPAPGRIASAISTRIPGYSAPVAVVAAPGTGVSLLALETAMCRRPLGLATGADQEFCGARTKPVPKGSRQGIGGFETYCTACASVLAQRGKAATA